MSLRQSGFPRVVIVILQYRRSEETARCLLTLASLDYPDYHVVVIDNHSGDGSAERIRREFPTVEVRETSENLGFAGGCNAGIGAALEDPRIGYVLLLNNDTLIAPDCLREMVAAAEADHDVVAVGAVNFSGQRHTSSGGFLDWWTGRYRDIFDTFPAAAIQGRPVIEVEAIAGSSMLVRADVLRAGVLLDPTFFCVYEETDWCLRLRSGGRRIVLATRAHVEHRVAGTMGKPLQLYFRFRNRPYFMAKHARPIHWVTFLPYYLAEAAGRVVGYTLVGRRADARGVLLGVWDAAWGVRGRGRLDQLLG